MTRLVVRLLVRLYPPAFRRRWGAELERDLCTLLERAEGSRRGSAWLAARTVGNALWRLAAEWYDTLRQRARDRVDGGGAMTWDDAAQDVRFAVRSLGRHPGFSAAAIATIALGIGATTAIFSAINGVLLRPLPYPESDELVIVGRDLGPDAYRSEFMSEPDLRDVQAAARSLESSAGYGSTGLTLTGLGEPERIEGARVTDPLLAVLGARPALGRDLTESEARLGGADVIVVSHDFWRGRLGGDPDVIGTTLELNGTPREIVGVAPPGLDFPGEAEFWVPWHLDTDDCGRGCHTLQVLARLADGVEPAAARRELELLAAHLRQAYPGSNRDKSFYVLGLHESVVGDVRAGLWLMLGAVTLVLLIGCANVANLLLVRASGRAAELAVRASLGAGRRRLTRQLLTESLVLAAVGGMLGLAVAAMGVRGLRALAPRGLPRLDAVAIDGTVLGFASLLVLAVAAGFGLVPALRGARSSLSDAVAAARTTQRPGGSRYRSVLLAVQTALSLVLLLGAGLLTRSFGSLLSEELGYRTEGVTTFNISLPAASYPPDERVRFFLGLDETLGSIPGVVGSGAIFGRPLGSNDISAGTKLLDRAPVPEGEDPIVLQRVVTPGYLETMGIPLLRGRAPTAADANDQPKVVLINQRFADLHYPGADPLGRQLDLDFSWGYDEDEPRTIIGIVADHRSQQLALQPDAELFIPQSQFAASTMSVVVRADVDDPGLLAEVRRRIAAIDPSLPLIAPRTMRDVVSDQLVTRRFFMLLLILFSATSLLLAAVGLAGVVAYTVSRRTREIGIRMALGARGPQVVRAVSRQALLPASIGIASGLAAGLAASRLLRSMLYGVGERDPVTVAAVTLAMSVVVAVATILPARRASAIAPARALRDE